MTYKRYKRYKNIKKYKQQLKGTQYTVLVVVYFLLYNE